MKNVAPIMLAATLTLSSFSTDLNDNLRPAEVTARGLITALRQSSEAKFVALFPTLDEFLRQMDDNAAFYGPNLEFAKAEFTETYVDELLPAVRRAYASLIEEAEKRGINWSDVEIKEVNIDNGLRVSFDQDGKQFDLLIERSIMIDGRWKISQYLKIQ